MQSYTGRPEVLAQSMMTDKVDAETTLNVALTDAATRGRFQIRVVDNQVPPQFIADAAVRVIELSTGNTVNRGTTDANGEVSIGHSLNDVGLFATKEYRIRVDKEGFVTQRQDVTAIAVAAIDVVIQLEPVAAP